MGHQTVYHISAERFHLIQSFARNGDFMTAWAELAKAGDRYASIACHVLSRSVSLMNCFRAAHWNYATGRDYANEPLWDVIALSSLNQYLSLMENNAVLDEQGQTLYYFPTTRQVENCYKAGISAHGLPPSSIIHLCGNQLGHKLNKRVEDVCHALADYSGPLKPLLKSVNMPDWHEIVGLSFGSLGKRGINNSDNVTELSDWQNINLMTRSFIKGVRDYILIKACVLHSAQIGLKLAS